MGTPDQYAPWENTTIVCPLRIQTFKPNLVQRKLESEGSSDGEYAEGAWFTKGRKSLNPQKEKI